MESLIKKGECMIFAQMNRDYLKEEYMESLIENTKLKEQYVLRYHKKGITI